MELFDRSSFDPISLFIIALLSVLLLILFRHYLRKVFIIHSMQKELVQRQILVGDLLRHKTELANNRRIMLLSMYMAVQLFRVMRNMAQSLLVGASRELPPAQEIDVTHTRILIKMDKMYQVIKLEDICWVTTWEKDRNFLEIKTTDGLIHGKMTLKDFESKLPVAYIFRVHRSWLVNEHCISKIAADYSYLIACEKWVPVSKTNLDELGKRFPGQNPSEQ